jgi:ketosteroid isomerase-like protein
MSNSSARIQEPVTGREPIADPTQPLFALSRFYRALNARDLTLMERNWESSPEAAMDNPLGGIRRGWPEIRQTYEALFSAPWTYSFEFWDYTLHRSAEMFWVVGRERGRLSREAQRLDIPIRTTRLFRCSDGGWRQVHHHGSIEDPRLLARYVTAIRGARHELA